MTVLAGFIKCYFPSLHGNIFIFSGGRYMVYETGAQGIVVAGLLERLGGTNYTSNIHLSILEVAGFLLSVSIETRYCH